MRIRWSSCITVSLLVACLMVSLSGSFVALAQGGLSSPGAPTQLFFDCKEAPEPQRPGDGLVGSIDRPVYGVGIPGSVYDVHSYAGLVWHNYDVGCIPGSGATSTIDTWMGNSAFNVAKFFVGAINWLHYLLADGGSIDQLDDLLQQGVRAMYTNIFVSFVSLAFLLLAVVVLYRVRGGELADSTRRIVIAFVGLVLSSLAYLAPVSLSQIADTLIIDELQAVQEEIIGLQASGSRDTLPTILVDEVIYQNWLKGEFGSADSPKADEFGRRLLLAQAFSKSEIATGQDVSSLIAIKKADFEAIAGQLGEAYPYFTGEQPSRLGAGVFAFLQIASVGFLQLIAKFLAVAAMLGLRLVVITLPLIGLVVILRPNTLYEVARLVLQLVFLALITGVVSALHALMFVSMYQSDINDWMAILILAVVEIVALYVLRPIRKLQGLIEGVRGPFGGNDSKNSSSWSKLRDRLPGFRRDPDRQSKWWSQREGERDPRAGGTVDVRRPEGQDVPRPRRSMRDAGPPPWSPTGQQPADSPRFRIYRSRDRPPEQPDAPPRE